MEETTNTTENTFNKQEFNSFVKDALSKIKTISESYKKLFEAEEGKQSIVLEIETSLYNIKKEYENLFNNNEAGVSKVSEINTKLEEIRNYHKELLEGDNSIKTDIKESQDKITEFYVYMFGGDGGVEGQEKKIKTLIEEITNFHTELTKEDGYVKSIENAHKLILETYNSLYTEVEGVPSRISKLREDIDGIESFNKKIKEEITPMLEGKQKIIENIEANIATKQAEVGSLLSDATVRTLAQGYLESMQIYGSIGFKKISGFNRDFFSSVLKCLPNIITNVLNYGLFVLPLVSIGIIFIEPQFIKDILRIQTLGGSTLIGSQYIFYKISVSLPLLWVSWFGERNISQRRRLFEEYNHKLRVVQMYILFISKERSYELLKISELEDALLEVIKRNPSEVYGKDASMFDKFIELAKAKKGIIDDVADKVKDPLSQTK
ncbi:hypothetical protein A2641_00480 [Candidatus Nomurabacteria bacterium RIFCSPHIGHO2_01_FULL_37_25]|nr:MAG: hypothetical protein A2641_00480 [Candidatus Nomurabacteria bacterium RIFCSPHIGHO2_01_FULL_37_25]OGI76097.1 MAG: hypothetical protein A3D36_01595 [Candidatus Nomurabacteria bacterium RIFCSPHIGHO2_02_FULL_36_29]